jgi:hypothetical protein
MCGVVKSKGYYSIGSNVASSMMMTALWEEERT